MAERWRNLLGRLSGGEDTVKTRAEMTVTAASWRAFTNRRLADLVLQRRLSVLQHLFQPAPADLGHGLSEPQQQLLRGLASAAGFSLWYHGAP